MVGRIPTSAAISESNCSDCNVGVFDLSTVYNHCFWSWSISLRAPHLNGCEGLLQTAAYMSGKGCRFNTDVLDKRLAAISMN